MVKQEYNFQRRIRIFLEDKDYVVLTMARSKPVDLLAMKRGRVYMIEIKAEKTKYPKEQQEMQADLVTKSGVPLVTIRQNKKKRGKIEFGMSGGTEPDYKFITFSLRKLIFKCNN